MTTPLPPLPPPPPKLHWTAHAAAIAACCGCCVLMILGFAVSVRSGAAEEPSPRQGVLGVALFMLGVVGLGVLLPLYLAVANGRPDKEPRAQAAAAVLTSSRAAHVFQDVGCTDAVTREALATSLARLLVLKADTQPAGDGMDGAPQRYGPTVSEDALWRALVLDTDLYGRVCAAAVWNEHPSKGDTATWQGAVIPYDPRAKPGGPAAAAAAVARAVYWPGDVPVP